MKETSKLPLKLSFRMTRADIAAYERLPREFSRAGVLAFFSVFFLTGMALGAFEDQLGGFVPAVLLKYQHILFVLAAALIAYGVVTLALTLRTNWRIARATLPAHETEVDVSEAGLRITDGGSAQDLGWNLVGKVIETVDHVFLCFTPRTALILPLRAFASIEAKRDFADLSEDLSRAADA
ncbi:MAG TPA: YcxB family protein [Hyphomicrobium sp.]|jgi:MFS family permease|nr:YcxB family protein [Hyphomicrobium sp.]